MILIYVKHQCYKYCHNTIYNSSSWLDNDVPDLIWQSLPVSLVLVFWNPRGRNLPHCGEEFWVCCYVCLCSDRRYCCPTDGLTGMLIMYNISNDIWHIIFQIWVSSVKARRSHYQHSIPELISQELEWMKWCWLYDPFNPCAKSTFSHDQSWMSPWMKSISNVLV